MDISEKIKQIQSSPPATKLRWIILCSALSFVIVIGIWVLAINSRLSSAELAAGRADEAGPGVGSRFVRASEQIILALRLRTANTIYYFQQKFSAVNTIEIKK